MSNAEQPLDDVTFSSVPAAEAPLPLGLDDAFRTATQLDPDDRLRLVARLWKSLPPDHRAALVTLQLEEAHGDRQISPIHHPSNTPIDPVWPKIYERLFDPKHTSDLYSAPRRFDLATIFVVTAAFSVILGGLSAIDAHPIVMVVVGSLLVIVAATQALFREVMNPRGISIVTGAIAFTLMCWIIMFSTRHFLSRSFFVNTFIFGIPGGAFLGYLAGTLVGGIFLVADILRGRFEARAKSNAPDEADAPASPFDESSHESEAAE
jgi:hypothetical protein